MSNTLTIGQVASLLEVTVKTIRHYHKKRLLEEPPRDASGYRRYRSKDVLRLVQIRKLASAGVALSDIPEILGQEGEQFEASIERIDEELSSRIQALVECRASLRQLQGSGVSKLPKQAQALVLELRRLGFDPKFVQAQADAMKLAAVVAPDLLDSYLPQMQSRIADPEHRALLKELWAASSWELDDPRLDALAEAMAKNLLANPDHLERHKGPETMRAHPERYRLINHFSQVPVASVLTRRIEAYLREAGLDIPSGT